MAMAIIRLTRKPTRWRDRGRRYVVLIDGEVVGKIKQGATADFAVEPGGHSLRLKIDWMGSDEITVRADEGQVVALTCAPSGSGAVAPIELVRRGKPWITLGTNRSKVPNSWAER
jgi:hypothetical protein